jgi:hypothetical protein
MEAGLYALLQACREHASAAGSTFEVLDAQGSDGVRCLGLCFANTVFCFDKTVFSKLANSLGSESGARLHNCVYTLAHAHSFL